MSLKLYILVFESLVFILEHSRNVRPLSQQNRLTENPGGDSASLKTYGSIVLLSLQLNKVL